MSIETKVASAIIIILIIIGSVEYSLETRKLDLLERFVETQE